LSPGVRGCYGLVTLTYHLRPELQPNLLDINVICILLLVA
jgi:hypothetical protein